MNKRARIGHSNKAVVNVWKREVGELSSRDFAHRLGASEVLLILLSFSILISALPVIFCMPK